MISTIAPFTNSSSTPAISHSKIHLIQTDPPKYKTHSKSLNHDILDLLVDEEYRDVILLTLIRSHGKRRIVVHVVPMDSVDGLNDSDLDDGGIETDLTCQAGSHIVCCWYKSWEEGGGRSILIANVAADGKEGLLCAVYLD